MHYGLGIFLNNFSLIDGFNPTNLYLNVLEIIMKYNHRIDILSAFIILILISGSVANEKTVTDLVGREVILSNNPQRVIALAPNITEIVFALGQQHRLKGVTMYSDFPVQASKLPKVGSYVHLDIERIVALKPDLCIAVKDGNPREIIMRLEAMNIPVYAINPVNLDSVIESINRIGELLNVSKRSKKLVQDISSRIKKVKFLVTKASYRPKVFFQIGISPIVSVGTHTFIHELIELAGGENLAKGPIPYPRFSREKIIALRPDVIIISSMARDEAFEKIKAQWSNWPELPAVRKNQIFTVDSNIFDRPSPRMVEGLEMLARLLHPEIFEGNQ